MNKKGFVFVELIITTVVLLISLLVLYNTYSGVIQDEKRRMYFDDISYVYKTETIRDIIAGTVDYGKFYNQYNSSAKGYIFLFSYGSNVWLSDKNELLEKTLDEYNVKRLVYIKIEDISKIKRCLNGKGIYSSSVPETEENKADKAKCSTTKSFISAYSGEHLSEYLKTIDVDAGEYEGHDAILIAMYTERKNGNNSETTLAGGGTTVMSYEKCIQQNVKSNPAYYNCPASASEQKKNECLTEAINKYNADDKASYSMECEFAYNMAWVYF